MTKINLYALLSVHPGTKALREGVVTSPLIDFTYSENKVANRGFQEMMRRATFDCGEIAIVTFMQAMTRSTPYMLLPATIVGRSQHHTIFYNADRGPLRAQDLNGKRIGVRAYTQTTGCWVRGFLKEDYGVDLSTLHWITFEDAHVADYKEPTFVTQMPETKTLKQMLLDGEIDAGILGDVAPEGPLKHLITDHEEAARKWALGHGGVPVNHMMALKKATAEEHPEAVKELYRVLKELRGLANRPLPGRHLDPLRFGVEENRGSIETVNRYAFEQLLIPCALTADEVFADFIRIMAR